MQKVYIDEKYFLNVQVEGNNHLPKIIFSNSLGSDLRLWDKGKCSFYSCRSGILCGQGTIIGDSSSIKDTKVIFTINAFKFQIIDC